MTSLWRLTGHGKSSGRPALQDWFSTMQIHRPCRPLVFVFAIDRHCANVVSVLQVGLWTQVLKSTWYFHELILDFTLSFMVRRLGHVLVWGDAMTATGHTWAGTGFLQPVTLQDGPRKSRLFIVCLRVYFCLVFSLSVVSSFALFLFVFTVHSGYLDDSRVV